MANEKNTDSGRRDTSRSERKKQGKRAGSNAREGIANRSSEEEAREQAQLPERGKRKGGAGTSTAK